MYTKNDLTFVICAYKENLYLEETIISLLNQTVEIDILLITSTPNEYISGLCKKYNLEILVNKGISGLGADWNFGYNSVNNKLVTIAHQDDIYEDTYAENIIKYANEANDPIIVFTDYYEIRNDKQISSNKILCIKRMINSPLSKRKNYDNKAVRRRCLSVGSAICCPSVTYVKKKVGKSPFNIEYKNSSDYKAYVDLSKKDGSFVYIPNRLIGHRIYPESTTTENLESNIRKKEDLEIFYEFWPKPLAKLINKVYSSSEKSNEV